MLNEVKHLNVRALRPFAELILSDAARFFAALRMTAREGLSMTNR